MDAIQKIMLNSIQNVLDSSTTASDLSKYCHVATSTISTIRTGKRPLDSMGLSLANSLYQFSIENGLNVTDVYQGYVQEISINLPISKLVVAKNPLDLFMSGYLENINTFPSSDLKKLKLHNSLFIDQQKQTYSTAVFNQPFTCGYSGSGPRALIEFVNRYSKASESELADYIFNSDFIEYDFPTNSIIVKNSIAEPEMMTLYSQHNQLIIALRDHLSTPGIPLGGLSQQPNFSEDAILNRIKTNLAVMRNLYHKDTEIQAVYYVPVFNTPETKRYDLTRASSHQEPEQYNTILKFKDFEIWTNLKYNQNRGDIFKNDLFTRVFGSLSLEYSDKRPFFKSIDAIQIAEKDSLNKIL
ncbi:MULTISPECIES: hypothetical protein [Latilactobacillus]|uniref:HTH cro/C1-type domain-containing protein n=1 Tax=Latilactobacillus curvatus TaxID=28038 RepID=A0ABN6GRY8_LATCU|nr:MULTISPECIES: hypothetical protein [Latilactobacillus]ASN13584.1 hypothetical protein B4V05_10150 [Latilactobacillus sakei]KGB13918.1 hypothetical protein KY41_10365 [Latilactobacillus sakei]MCW8780341.1 hypothetical protein [Latilactobacillus curvatus]BCX31530.1 hypothetical protein LTWDN19_20970 [Latilactobacillus curvatus]